MSAEARKPYTAEFHREGMALVTEQGYTLVAASRNLGLNQDMLRRWKRQLVQEGGVAFPCKVHQTLEQAELHRLRVENRRIQIERDILYKKPRLF